MKKPCFLSGRGGAVLILALWVLGFLAMLSLAIGLGARQKITLLSRLESRAAVRAAVSAGAKKAAAVLAEDVENSFFAFTAASKSRRHNNPADFASILVGQEAVQVSYLSDTGSAGQLTEYYGLADEQAKININAIDRPSLARLLVRILRLEADEAGILAGDILDWRDYGQHTAEGFFSDSYYLTLESPYEMKSSPFERMDELLLVKGMDWERYELLLPYVTVYGNGKVNINTAGRSVLIALGLTEEVADKILLARRGQDDMEATADDHVFMRAFDVAGEVKMLAGLQDDQVRQIDELNARGLLGVDSYTYSFFSRRVSSGVNAMQSSVYGVFDALGSKVLAWVQK